MRTSSRFFGRKQTSLLYHGQEFELELDVKEGAASDDEEQPRAMDQD